MTAIKCETRLAAFKRGEEQAIFERLLTSQELMLAVSDDERLGFEMPRKDTVPAGMYGAYRFKPFTKDSILVH